MSDTNVFDGKKIHVMERKCSTCIYRPGNLMHLEPGRKDAMQAEAIAGNGVIPCHKTIQGAREQQAVCRGFYDVAKHDGLLGMGERMGVIQFDPTA
jgi:hypothetical protein